MLIDILNWMIARSPGFIRPALEWLVEGIRQITNHVVNQWNRLGEVFAGWVNAIVGWSVNLIAVAVRIASVLAWLRNTFIPYAISITAQALRVAIDTTAAFLRGLIDGGLDALRRWVDWLIATVTNVIDAVKAYATHWIERLIETVSAIIRAIQHVINGPDVLAEWLVGSMWRAMARYASAQRERIVMWLTRESVTFTRWLATELESIIMRWL